jgi:hypothetical protein
MEFARLIVSSQRVTEVDIETFSFHIGVFVAPDGEGIHLVPIPTCSPPPCTVKVGHMEPKVWIRYKLDPWIDLAHCMDIFSSDAKFMPKCYEINRCPFNIMVEHMWAWQNIKLCYLHPYLIVLCHKYI